MKSTRRHMLKSTSLSTLAAATGVGLLSRGSPAVAQIDQQSGPLAQATVSWGQWQGDQEWDRTDPEFNPILANHHGVSPQTVKIRAGGAISYIISGFHQILVYDDGTQPEDIDASTLVNSQGPLAPPFPILIDDPVNRIFRGLDPGSQSEDRIESVTFSEPGTYLVICGVVFHFVDDNMFGYVRVVP